MVAISSAKTFGSSAVARMLLVVLVLVVSSCEGSSSFDDVGDLEVTLRCGRGGVAPRERYVLHRSDGSSVRVTFPAGHVAPISGRVRVSTVNSSVVAWSKARGALLEERMQRRRVMMRRAKKGSSFQHVGYDEDERERYYGPNVDMWMRSASGGDEEEALIVRAVMPSMQEPCSEQTLVQMVWDGDKSAARFWGEATQGNIRLVRDWDGDGRADTVTAVLSSVPATCDDVWPAVRTVLEGMQVEWSRWKRRVVMLPPQYGACGWAQATIGCPVGAGCFAFVTACESYPDSIIHELGHTFALRHGAASTTSDPSSATDDYGDRSTTMGYSYPDAPMRGLNSIHKMSVGGLFDSNIMTLTAGFSGQITISALARPDTSIQPALKVAIVPISGVPYYISYRVAYPGTIEEDLSKDLGGPFGPSYAHIVQIHSQQLPAHSFLWAVLRNAGESYVITGTTVNVTLVSAGADSADVLIQSGSFCGNGLVEDGEQCDGGACCTSDCHFFHADIVCRSASGLCDLPEVCSGTSSTCPSDLFAPIGTICRNATSACDAPDTCNGGGSCPNAALPDGTVCTLTSCPIANTGNCINRQCVGNCASTIVTSTTTTVAPSSTSVSPSSTSVSPSSTSVSPTTIPSSSSSSSCGDGVCSGSEDCVSCPRDCPSSQSMCCSGWGCVGRKCPPLFKVVETCRLSSSGPAPCLSPGSFCSSDKDCCGSGICVAGQCS